MSLTVANLITNFDTYFGDSSTDRISQAERFQFLTEATAWAKENGLNDHGVDSYDFNFYDSVNYYKITTAVGDLFEANDLRKRVGENEFPFTRKSSTELSNEIANGEGDNAWSIERRDGDSYIIVTQDVLYPAKTLSYFNSTTDGGGTWVADTTGSDATNVTQDNNEFLEGTASLNFDVDVSQSGNNLATIYNASANSADLSDYEDIASFIFEVYIPDVTNFSSITLSISSDTSSTPSTISNYLSATATTDIDGSAFVDGWNTVKIDWANMTKTSSPDYTAIVYYQFDFNYTGSQGDDTDFRIDNFRIVRPEKLKLYYQSWNVGNDTNGADITAFSATTDVPYFSGRYDQYKYPVAHKATALAYESLGMYNRAVLQEQKAVQSLQRINKTIPTSLRREQKTFKVHGIRF